MRHDENVLLTDAGFLIFEPKQSINFSECQGYRTESEPKEAGTEYKYIDLLKKCVTLRIEYSVPPYLRTLRRMESIDLQLRSTNRCVLGFS